MPASTLPYEQRKYGMYPILSLIVIILVFIYLAVRTFTVDPILDETFSFHYFSYLGFYKGHRVVYDANNHFLNSFFGNTLYPFFGKNILLYRIPNLLSFLLYSAGIVKIGRYLETERSRFLLLITFCSIPFIVEYFALFRGYGLSIAFFVFSISFLLPFLQQNKLKHLCFSLLFLSLCIASNLTFLVPALLVLFYIILHQLLNSNRSFKKSLLKSGIYLLFIGSLIPFVFLGIKLKNHGALYIGSLDGFWAVTGSSVCEKILFSFSVFWKYILAALLLAGVITAIVISIKQKLVSAMKEPLFLFVVLVSGNLIAILFLALFMKVNYPVDRASFSLIILFILMLFFLFDRSKTGRLLQFSFLLFPISFILKMNISTTLVAPKDSMSDEFYQKVKAYVGKEKTIGVNGLFNFNWYYKESFSKNKSSVILYPIEYTGPFDVLATTDPLPKSVASRFDTLALDPNSGFVAYKRKIELKKTLVHTFPVSDSKNYTKLYLDLYKQDTTKQQLNGTYVYQVKGHLKNNDPRTDLQLVAVQNKPNGEKTVYFYLFNRAYIDEKIDADFQHNFVFTQLPEEETTINIYLWNQGGEKLQLTNSSVTIYHLASLPE